MPLAYKDLTRPTVEPVSLDLAKQHLRLYFADDDLYVTALITAARELVEAKTNRAIFNRKMLLTMDQFPWPGWDSTTGCTTADYYMTSYYRGLNIRLPKPRLVSVESIAYLANDGVTTTTIDPSCYVVDTTSEPSRIAPAPGYTWPYQQNFLPGQVQVTYTAGSWEQQTSETFTVPTSPPYQYQILQPIANVVTFVGVTDGAGDVVYPISNAAGLLTFDPSLIGQTLTVTYTYSVCPQSIVFAILLLVKHWYNHRESTTELNLKDAPTAVDALLASHTLESFAW